jgi:hypothetical protein
MSELLKKVLKNSKNPYISQLEKSEIFGHQTEYPTDIYGLNIALSGSLFGGYQAGIVTIAGRSKNFKSLFGLEMAKAFLRKHQDGVLIFFDSEFGSPRGYFDSFGDMIDRVVHAPIVSLEDFRTQILNHIDGVSREDKIMFLVDSIGNLASTKETEDALDGKNIVDMTKAKVVKSIFRIITPLLVLKDIPLVQISHTYQSLELFSKEILSGGTGITYSSNTIIFVGKSQEKDGTDIIGWNFTLNIEKSRYVREKSKIPILVTYESGINKYSSVFELAEEFGFITKPSQGWYEYKGNKSRRKDIESNLDIMEEIIKDTKFQQLVESKYKLFS